MGWSWTTENTASDAAEFETREEAIKDAQDSGEREVYVGEVVTINPVDYTPLIDVEQLMLDMDENSDINYNGPIFETNPDGVVALDNLIKEWVKKHVKSNVSQVLKNDMKVVL